MRVQRFKRVKPVGDDQLAPVVIAGLDPAIHPAS
jgi:hypothetical protein